MNPPGWFFDEFAHAGDEHLDPEYVAAYDRKAGFDPAEDLALLHTLGLNESSVLVDMGAGTGSLALAAAPLCARVVAVDVSPTMLAVLRARAERSEVENIEIVQGGFLSYIHQGALADLAYSRHALHHLPDFWKAIALERMAAMLKPGGVLHLRDLIFSFEPGETETRIEAWLAGAAARTEDGWTRTELEIHLRTEYSPFSWLLEAMLERTGFQIQTVDRSASGIYAAYTCVKK